MVEGQVLTAGKDGKGRLSRRYEAVMNNGRYFLDGTGRYESSVGQIANNPRDRTGGRVLTMVYRPVPSGRYRQSRPVKQPRKALKNISN